MTPENRGPRTQPSPRHRLVISLRLVFGKGTSLARDLCRTLVQVPGSALKGEDAAARRRHVGNHDKLHQPDSLEAFTSRSFQVIDLDCQAASHDSKMSRCHGSHNGEVCKDSAAPHPRQRLQSTPVRSTTIHAPGDAVWL